MTGYLPCPTVEYLPLGRSLRSTITNTKREFGIGNGNLPVLTVQFLRITKTSVW
jgi:hypothetical protein